MKEDIIDIIIVGGGVGGICCGIYLLNKGFKVTIIEKNQNLGGKMNLIEENGFKFDLNATIVMSPSTYTNVFKDANRNYEDYFKIKRLSPMYKVFNYDNKEVTIYDEIDKKTNELEKIEEGLSKDFEIILRKSYKKYCLIKNDFLDKPMINLGELLNMKSIMSLIKINPLSRASNYISRLVKNDILRNYLIFKSMYIGIDPFENSNIHTLVPALCHMEGIGYFEGGLYTYIKAVTRLFTEMGGKIINNTKVDKILIENEKIVGVKTKEKIINSDIVVCNSDYSYTIDKLIEKDDLDERYNKENISNKDYSCSTFILYLGLDKIYHNLQVHNIYLNKDFKNSIQGAFKGFIPDNPSLYMYYPSIVDKSFAKEGNSSLNITLRVPNLSLYKGEYSDRDCKKIRNIIIETIKHIPFMEDIEEHIVYENYLTPNDLATNYNCYYGNAFGLSHKLLQSIYFRPHIKSNKVKGLYFLNASTHPGNGTSVVIGGSKVLSKVIEEDFSTRINHLHKP